jgi:phosphoribosylformylglycinamidine synthase
MTEYLRVVHRRERGLPPELDLDRELNVVQCCREAIRRGIIKSAHDLSEGGLAIALVECSLLTPFGPQGSEIILSAPQALRLDALLFGESQSRILVTISESQRGQMGRLTEEFRVPMTVLGRVGGDHLSIRLEGKEPIIHIPLKRLEEAWKGAIPRYFET